MNVPFIDLKAQYLSIKSEIDATIFSVINESAFIGGDYVKCFEDDFSKYINVSNVIGCANGTDSLEIIIKALGIGPGDEVIVPALSWFSTSEAVSSVGANPIFVDIEKEFYTIDTKLIEEKITSKTKAIIPVHLYGQAADMKTIISIAKKYNLKVIEDCAQSHGAEFERKNVGNWGDASSFSFYPGKNLGAYGDAGCMATNNEELAKVFRMIANHGQLKKHDHVMVGRNSRLDGLHAAVLSVKLKYLEEWTKKRIENAEFYDKLLQNSAIGIPKKRQNGRHVYHLYVVQVENRDSLINRLLKKGIQTAVHYPTALPLLKAYSFKNLKPSDFPIAFALSERILSIPMYAELTKDKIDYVAESLKELVK
jgi:dTDP-4-amino-4,6-dideoxygalactose transaminase